MTMSRVMLAVVVMGCGGGGGGDGYPTDNGGNGPGTGSGTGTGGGTAAASAAVSMSQGDDGYGTAVFSFSPAAVTIRVGGTVTWSNEGGGVLHNVTFAPSSGAPANVSNFNYGTQTRTFSAAGSFSYQCTNHTGMTGQVTVQ